MKLLKAALALAVILIAGKAEAHLLREIPFPEIGSLQDVVDAHFPRGTPVSTRVQKNLVSDYGATCNGVANDSAAFLAFKAAYQGTTPVQLNLPGNCTFQPIFNGTDSYTFDGIADLIVQGTGTGSSSIKSFAGSQLILGGRGQYQDSSHSVRTNDANAGDSCVILKTTPAVTVSGVTSNLPLPAEFTASLASGNILTVSAVASGTIAPGAFISNAGNNGNITSFTYIMPYGTGGTTGVGGTGTYQLSATQTPTTRPSQPMWSYPATFTASVATTGIMTVTAVTDGTISPGMYVYASSGIGKVAVMPYGTGGTTGVGGTGTYKLAAPPTSAVSSQSFIGNGQPRVTLNSTTGLTTGDTLFLTGITGQGVLPQRTNGLQWIKVINGTQVDLFQSDFNGGYTSGGTGAGDRTALFPIGAKVLMTGWVNQAYWQFPYGYPSNPHFFEYKTVVSNNSGTHQVCFDTPLTNTYKASWPQMNTGSQYEVDPGGPATLYVYPPSWETTIVFKDLTIDNPTQQTYMQGRNVTLNNVVMTGGSCVAPTQNETVNWINVTGTSCDIETDKIVKNWNVTNYSGFKVVIQSSSFTNVNVDGVTLSGGWYGSGKKLTMQNANVGDRIDFGITAYGSSDESSCTNCAAANGVSRQGSLMRVDLPGAPWSMSGGVITIPNAYGNNPGANDGETQYRGLTPGGYFIWLGLGGGGTSPQVGRVDKVVAVTQDVDNTYIQVANASTFPTGAWTTNGLQVSPHPAPKLTTSGMSGSNSAIAFNGCPAQSPMYSCQNFTYTGGASGISSGYAPTLWGVIDTFTFTNNVPFTNTGALGWTVTPAGNIQTLLANLTTQSWGNSNMINTKLPSSGGGGTRTLTSSGATGTQSLDNIPVPAADGWFGGGANGPAFTTNTPSDSPQVTMTLRTNQQLPP